MDGYYLGEDKTKLESPDPFALYSAYIAYVSDNAFFGLTSPLRGHRYRFQVGRTEGRIRTWELLGDYRTYFFFKPLGLGFRIMHFGRYGDDAREFNPLFLGYPYYVRGYSYRSLRKNKCTDGGCLDVNQITGSKMLISGAEARLPFTGPKRLAVIKTRYFYSDLVWFLDAGLAWHDFDNIAFSLDPAGNKHIPIFSTGLAVRINLFGVLILEPYYAIPLTRNDLSFGQLGFYLSGGGW